jgi:hypothetical protein
MRLLERPWLIIARTSRSRAVSGSLTLLAAGPRDAVTPHSGHPTAKAGFPRNVEVRGRLTLASAFLKYEARIAIVARRNLMIRNAAIYCTPVVGDSYCFAALKFGLQAAAKTLFAFGMPQGRGVDREDERTL